MKINAKPLVLAFTTDRSVKSQLKLALICANPAQVSLTRPIKLGLKSPSPPGTACLLINHKSVATEGECDSNSLGKTELLKVRGFWRALKGCGAR